MSHLVLFVLWYLSSSSGYYSSAFHFLGTNGRNWATRAHLLVRGDYDGPLGTGSGTSAAAQPLIHQQPLSKWRVTQLAAQRQLDDNNDDDDDLVRVPRGGRRRGARGQERPDADAYYYDDSNADGEREPRGRYASGRDAQRLYDEEIESEDDEGDDEEEDWLFDEDDDDDDDAAELGSGLLENIVLPNPLLDSMDPDGAADRFPELARDPRFWLDMALFVAFLNFLSSVGPRDPFPDLPWY